MAYVAITIEGGLFSADLLEQLAATPDEVPGQRAGRLRHRWPPLSDEIQAAFSDAQRLLAGLRGAARPASPGQRTTAHPRASGSLPLLETLGLRSRLPARGSARRRRQLTPSRISAGDEEGAPPVHIVAFDQPTRPSGRCRASPHALVQDYLNRSDALWGVVTNGRKLRLLRDSARLRQADLHRVRSRGDDRGQPLQRVRPPLPPRRTARAFPRACADAHECWLERYYQQGIERGRPRARAAPRAGVEKALRALGTGFLAHPDSGAPARAATHQERHRRADYYRQLLRLVYRLLFLMVAEERRLLLVPDHENAAPPEDLHRLVQHRAACASSPSGASPATATATSGKGLKQTFRLFRDDEARRQLGL